MKEIAFHSNKKWNNDECQCNCKELDDWCSFKNGYTWNFSTCCYKCKKTCKIDEYLDIKKFSILEKMKMKSITKNEVFHQWFLQ